MSTPEIILISALCGMFGLALLAGVAFLIWLAIELRKTQRAVQAENTAIQNKTQTALDRNEQETKSTLESAKSSFSAIRAEMKVILDSNQNKTTALLEEHKQAMQVAIGKINAEALTAAAVRCFEACTRLEKTITIFQRLILENTDQREPSNYAPEEYAPERTEFGGPPSGFSLSVNANADTEAERESGALQESGAV
jgi:hypothetical protein